MRKMGARNPVELTSDWTDSRLTAVEHRTTIPPKNQERIAVAFHGPRRSLCTHPDRDQPSPEANAAIESVCTTAADAGEAQAQAAGANMAGWRDHVPTPETKTEPNLSSRELREPTGGRLASREARTHDAAVPRVRTG